MKGRLGTLNNYLIIYGLFVKNCLIAQLEYRANFVLGLAVELAYLISKLLYVVVVYKTDLHIDGITPDGMLMFVGTYTIMTGVYSGLFFTNFVRMPEYVRNGSLDLMIVKPISLQFLVSLRYLDLGMPIPNVVAGVAMVAIGWNAMEIPLTAYSIVLYMLFLGIGVIITYCLMIVPALLSFWFVNTGGLSSIFYAIWDANNMPMPIYGRWIQRIGVYVLPFLVITNFAPLAAMNALRIDQMMWGAAAPVLLLISVRVLWNKAIRNYSSANG
ncbi:ABC transporter permease [Paenibacillus sp. BIHB 4019]|uniref:ABC transporter permease n=1 Tax=Paenibacillus sp. BIHB 4019 TaxID=1870819 RepID=A0A1B2DNT2_9BACL|nr:ABC-2 family transporter protein [Paenibacillus sp. BIHB 4019]ANY69364.1 ABC transporter permease [Paenibacillus sp. BIHB 4019]